MTLTKDELAQPLEGPVLDLGSGMGGMTRELARRGLEVESVDVNAEDQEVAASLTQGTGLGIFFGRSRFS